MLGSPIVIKRGAKDEAEKPFWISFADLMTALMVLFLVVMSVSLLAVTRTVSEANGKREEREKEIGLVLEMLAENIKNCRHAVVRRDRYVIDFGTQATFETNSHRLSADQAKYLRSCVPEVLAVARHELGKKWIKRIVVEGYADRRGTYLHNLNLSLQRSQRVLCVLLAPPGPDERPFTQEELEQIRDLFLVGGYSFNSAKASLEESRRIELRLEFWGVDESRVSPDDVPRTDFGSCALGA